VDGLRDLHRELAGRHQHQRGRRRGPGPHGDALQDGERERRGLAGARRGLPQQVPARDQRRDRLALDRRRLLVPQARERGEQLVAQTELGEARPGDPVRIGAQVTGPPILRGRSSCVAGAPAVGMDVGVIGAFLWGREG
jgi:hypothetical protein